jgi:hypothetical protein
VGSNALRQNLAASLVRLGVPLGAGSAGDEATEARSQLAGHPLEDVEQRIQPQTPHHSSEKPSATELFEDDHPRLATSDVVTVRRDQVPMILALLGGRGSKQEGGLVTLEREECQRLFCVQSSDEPRRCPTEASVTVVDQH